MQRAPCCWSLETSICKWNSFQSLMRSMADRSSGSSRRYSINPVGFPIFLFTQVVVSLAHQLSTERERGTVKNLNVLWSCRATVTPMLLLMKRESTARAGLAAADARFIFRILLESSHDGFFAGQALFLRFIERLQDAFVILGHDFDEFGDVRGPVFQNASGVIGTGVFHVLLDHLADAVRFGRFGQLLEANHLLVAARGEISFFIDDISDAAGHAGCKVSPARTEDDDRSASHVFATVIADGFNYGLDAGIADRETFAGHAADVNFAAGGAVESDVTDDDVALGLEGLTFGRINDDFAAGKAFADVIVGVAFKAEGHAVRNERAEALAGRTFKVQLDGVFGQAFGAVFARDFAAENRADNAVDVSDLQVGNDLFFFLERRLGQIEERFYVHRILQAVVLLDRLETSDIGADVRLIKDFRKVEAAGFPMIDRFTRFEAIGAADQFRKFAKTHLRHNFANFLRDELHEVHGMSGIAGEFFAKFGILRGDADRAGVQMANAHHD